MGNNQLENVRTFRKTITAADGTGIIEILNCADSFAEYAELGNSYYVGRSFYLEALSGAVHLPSYQQAAFAEIFPEMNAAERIAALLVVEKEYPFVGLIFHARKGANGTWSRIATARLQNRGRETTIPFVIPYLTVGNVKLLSPDDRLGISIFNYGHGVLGAGDYINFEGDYRFTLDLIPKPQIRTIGAALPYGVDIGATPIQFRANNINRAILFVTNIGSVPVWVGDSSVSVGNGIYLAPNGNGNLTEKTLTSELWAIAEGDGTRICGIEAKLLHI